MLTAAEICTKARGIAKCAGYSTQSGEDLNLVLSDLVLHRNLKINRYPATVSVTAGTNGPFNLPDDYLRTYDLFYVLNGIPYFLDPMGLDQYDALYKDPSIANYPSRFATDLQPQAATPDTGIALLYIYPQSNAAIDLTHRYMIRRDDISTPAASSSIPWFPDQDYLVHATATRLMKLTDDARWPTFVEQGEAMLRQHLLTEGDEQQVVKEVRLDPQRFRTFQRLKPTKTQPW